MSAGKAWTVAASIGAVEALKDQLGFCRWNYGLRLMQQHAKASLISHNRRSTTTHSQSSSSSSSASAAAAAVNARKDKVKKREESFDKVMNLSCFGPSSIRF